LDDEPGLLANMPKVRLGAILEPSKFMNEEIIAHVPTFGENGLNGG